MRKNNLYIKIKRFADHGMFLTALCLFLLPSCTKDEEALPDTPEVNERCEATIRLNVGAFGLNGSIGTRSVGGNADENRINNIWVFQYNVETGESMRNPVYLSENNFNSNDIDVDLTLNENGQHSVVCIVANVGKGVPDDITDTGTGVETGGDESSGTAEKTWVFDEHGNIKEEFKTYQKFLEQAIPAEASQPFISSHMGESGGKVIPMFGESKEMVIASKCYVSVPLVRMFARLEVKVDPSDLAELGMEIKDVSFHNIPSYCRVSSLVNVEGYHNTEAATYPADIEWANFNEVHNENDIILYLPENLQGIVSGMAGKKETDTEKIPEKALCVALTMSYEKDGEPKTHTYTVYPGFDMDNDFNIARNHIFNVNIKITKLPE